jgi:hypothetical protein
MEENFAIENLIKYISLEQFQDSAYKIYQHLKTRGENFSHNLHLTTDYPDYEKALCSTIVTPESKAAHQRIQVHNLFDLTQEIWNNSFERTFFIKEERENSQGEYAIWVSNEINYPKQITIRGTNLTNISSKAIVNIKKANQFKIRTPQKDSYLKGTLYHFKQTS